MDIIQRLWEDCPIYMPREQFEKTLEGWTLDPVEQDGKLIGVFVVNGPHFHFAKFDDTPARREHLRRYPGSLIERYGYAETKTPKDDARQLRFNQRLGFFVTGEDEHYVHLRIEAMRQKKESPCQ